MAGIYSGIHLKLKNSKVSWEHKLKVAHFAWISHQCFIPNKEQFLLDWVSQSLAGIHAKKLNVGEDVVQKLWIFLDNMLHSQRLQRIMEEGKSLKLRFSMAQVMNDNFSITPPQSSLSISVGTVLSCCHSVLTTPCFGMVYRAKCELMVELLSRLCLLACHCLTSEHGISKQVLDVLNLSLKQYTLLQRQQANNNRLFMQVLTQLFEPCLRLRNALSSHVFDKDSSNGIHQLIKDIEGNIEVILQAGLFQAELLIIYKEQLLSDVGKLDKIEGSFKDCFTPVCSMLTKLEKIEFCEEDIQLSFLANSVPFLYKLFLDSYCRDGNETLCFQMLVRLLECLCGPFQVKDDHLNILIPVWPKAGMTGLDSMLNLAVSHNIYNIAEDNIRGKGNQYKFYRNLTQMLVRNPCIPSLPWFKCLKTLNTLNHLIVEPDLADILHACFDADISDMRIRKAQETLVVSLLQTYTKLRQFPKLFQKILSVIGQPQKMKQPFFLSGLTKKLTEFLVQIPPNQMLDMWAMILENYQLAHIEEDPNLSLKLEYLSSLLHCLMMNMKSLDGNTPLAVIYRLQQVMKQIANGLILPSLTIVKNQDLEASDSCWLQKLCEVVLMLVYTWIEVNTVTALNCDKYVSQMCELALPLDSPLECWDFSIFFEDRECWQKVHTVCRQSNVPAMFYFGLLSIHKMKILLTRIHMPSESDRLTLQASASFFVNSSSNLLEHKDQKPYRGNMNAASVHCLPIAQWHFIVSNITLLLPYISLGDMNHIADFLLVTQLPGNGPSKLVDNDVTVDLKAISKGLLQSDSFSEMCILQCIFITRIINKCATLVMEKTVLHEILLLLSLKNSDWHENVISVYNKGATIGTSRVIDSCDDSVFVTNMKNVLELVSSVVEDMDEFVNFTDGEMNLLMDLAELICELNPDSLLPSDLCRCFFFLLLLANVSSLRSLHVASVCYRSLTCLLSSTHANSLFKIAYASDFLNIVLTCFRSANWDVTEGNEQYWLKFLHIINLFFDTFFSLVIKRKQSVLINLEKSATFVLNAISNTERTFWNTCKGQLHIVILKNLCHHLATTIKVHNENLGNAECLNGLLHQTVVKLKSVIQQCLDITASSPFLPTILVTSTTTLLEAELCAEGNIHNTELYKTFYSQILRDLCFAKEQNAFLKSSLHYLTVYIGVKTVYPTQQGLPASVFTTVGDLLASPWFVNEILQDAEIELQHLINRVIEDCTCEEFHALLKFVLNKLEVCNLWSNDYKVLFAGVTMIRLLLNCSLHEDKSMLFWSSSSQMITALVTLSIEACKERRLLSSVVGPVLDAMALFLRRGEMFLSNPHHVTLSLGALLMVSLENVRAEDYYYIILAIHKVLFSVLQCHPKVMLKSIPTFLSCFHRLVASVMHEGRQKGDKGATYVQKCAKLVERMYTYIAAKTEEFTVFSTFMVSRYIHELQKVTLQPEVKKSLTEGIFHILDLCIDRDVKFLNASLQIGAREVFKELYLDYSSHYKTKNQEEAKYTA
ncbi:unhealthy ribosome biogenesis protein 2 homolog isoform X2 [Ranitomeya imitator]|uniref:unhealthy ribosome biogenesis protein 2 homolog isoform X2 n=1 Tax=Ranitomeya imitator TaxID=111125 RepID=UPI0037E7F3C0